jgi:tetratricopeptide (TPR) repeat protein
MEGKIMSGHLDYEINKELGECYLFMGELDKAEQYYTKAASSNGVHADPYLGLAAIAIHRGQLDGALSMYQKAHKVDPTDKTHAGIALVLMEQGRGGDAIGHFVEALKVNPENMVALFSLVRLGHEQNRLEEVIPHLSRYLEIDPGKSEVRYSLAGCLVCLDRKDEARAELERILEGNSDFEPAKELLAQL